MKPLQVDIDIHVTPEAVWQHLIDFAAYGDWNPLITAIEGQARERAQLEVAVQVTSAQLVMLQPTISRLIPREELRWKWRFLGPGLHGEHRFLIEPRDDGGVRFRQVETMRGFLAGAILANWGQKIERGLERMSRALKERAES